MRLLRASIWESARKQGDVALKRLINAGIEQTSNTCVLIGNETYLRPCVRHELLKSFQLRQSANSSTILRYHAGGFSESLSNAL